MQGPRSQGAPDHQVPREMRRIAVPLCGRVSREEAQPRCVQRPTLQPQIEGRCRQYQLKLYQLEVDLRHPAVSPERALPRGGDLQPHPQPRRPRRSFQARFKLGGTPTRWVVQTEHPTQSIGKEEWGRDSAVGRRRRWLVTVTVRTVPRHCITSVSPRRETAVV